ncbi:MAG TPA: HD-GYP domain-containing protein [Symbiobacteriaceae bacterium]|nr:HD-GYP domain-containing protein [Symbiobacteriaceae bacterium]
MSAIVAPGFSLGEKVGRLLGIAGGRAGTALGPEEATEVFLKALYTKSPMTAQHSERVAGYAVALGLALDLPWAQVRHLERCGLLHDMGKIGVEESILAKPGALSDEEWQSVRTHPDLGVQVVGSCPVLEDVLPAVAYHHERLDGKGYPYGIGGDDLPLDVRIITICDAYDSMTADRPYRRGMPVAEAVRRLVEGAGTQFDPELVNLFVAQVVPNLPGGTMKAS